MDNFELNAMAKDGKDLEALAAIYREAQRLLWVCNRFHPIPVDLLPPDSLLREFLGGSAFEY